eukprot:CAMPEP_0116916232 /NCGR_PEP_ID=MMETSP0467-20121206/18403_1 /TAXON_ID=283647 /ORGANISM="Mesodinium pulex, Strain SPMC105" /LENGTH=34 /DNA_ID= /DNA_START= /DNA_END= /DNA_ORIENTATION=
MAYAQPNTLRNLKVALKAHFENRIEITEISSERD